jgi:hypothetical protein
MCQQEEESFSLTVYWHKTYRKFWELRMKQHQTEPSVKKAAAVAAASQKVRDYGQEVTDYDFDVIKGAAAEAATDQDTNGSSFDYLIPMVLLYLPNYQS